ncbi:MAG: hypothetical protein JXB32_02970 [Deltaproteobacteria bacterium]|nr:hypothetical protein [Deltaproteobacteria bacterium]
MSPVRPRLPLLLALLATATTGCAPDRTALLVHVCIAVDVPDEITFVRLVVDHATRPDLARVFRLPVGRTFVTYSIRPGDDLFAPEDFLLSVVGLDEHGHQRITRTVRTWFEPDLDRDVALTLEAACLDRGCTHGETCQAGICIPIPTVDDSWCPDEL